MSGGSKIGSTRALAMLRAAAGHAAGGGLGLSPSPADLLMQPRRASQTAPKRSRDINTLAAVTPAKGQRVSVKVDDGSFYQVRRRCCLENTQQAHSRAWFGSRLLSFSGEDHRVRSEAGGLQTVLGYHHRL
jgi:hypothetical protein